MNILKKIKKTILMIGAPGVGKGTYSKMLSLDLNIPELSSGEELRKLVKNHFANLNGGKSEIHLNHKLDLHNEIGTHINEIKILMDEGKLVNDDFIHKFMIEKLSNEEYNNGVILDGYPRTYQQAKEFEKMMKMDLVVKIELREDILIKKLLGRRVCNNCGKNYNVCSIKQGEYDMKPLLPKKKINKCDECDGELLKRKDDNLQTIQSRLIVYKELTRPLEHYYQDQGIVITLEPKKGIDDYPMMLKTILENLNKL